MLPPKLPSLKPTMPPRTLMPRPPMLEMLPPSASKLSQASMAPQVVTSLLMLQKMIASQWPSCLCLKRAICLRSGCPHHECLGRRRQRQGHRLHRSWASRGRDLYPHLVLHHVSSPLSLKPRRSLWFTPQSSLTSPLARPPLLPRQPLSLCVPRVPAQVPSPLPRPVNRFLPPPVT